MILLFCLYGGVFPEASEYANLFTFRCARAVYVELCVAWRAFACGAALGQVPWWLDRLGLD